MLRKIVHDWAGDSAEPAEITPLSGGSVSTTLLVTLQTRERAVLKITLHRVDRSYEVEAHQLELMRSAGVPVPQVYRWKIGSLEEPFSYLLMQYIEGVDWAQARTMASTEQFAHLQRELAECILKLHSTTAENYCRACPDATELSADWPVFYRSIFEPIWLELQKSSHIHPKGRKLIGRVRDRLDWLIAHDDSARLVHWDLWAANILARPDGSGNWHIAALLDPNCKFAHMESELAYLELFNTVSPPFMKAYQAHRKLGEQYHRVRKPVYQLHSLMNHLHVFGDAYAKPFHAALDKVATIV